MISNNTLSPDIVNDSAQSLSRIKLDPNKHSQLKKVTQEFEAIFVTKMLTLMDKTVDKESGIFGQENKYMDTFKSYIFTEMGRQIATNPQTSFGFAKQMYEQMEKTLPKEPQEAVENKNAVDLQKQIRYSSHS